MAPALDQCLEDHAVAGVGALEARAEAEAAGNIENDQGLESRSERTGREEEA